MLKKKFRLLSPIGRNAKNISSPLFSVKVTKNSIGNSRFGFIVSKKIDKRATVRNRLKRVFRNKIEKDLSDITQGFDFLFIIRKNFLKQQVKIEDKISDFFKKNQYIKL